MQKDFKLNGRIRRECFEHGDGQFAIHIMKRTLRVQHEDDRAELIERDVPSFWIQLTTRKIPDIDRYERAIFTTVLVSRRVKEQRRRLLLT